MTDGGVRPWALIHAPFSNDGVAVLPWGRDVLHCFDDERRLRDLPYLDLLETIENAAGTFRRAFEALESRKSDT